MTTAARKDTNVVVAELELFPISFHLDYHFFRHQSPLTDVTPFDE